jgi:hypothetical protein
MDFAKDKEHDGPEEIEKDNIIECLLSQFRVSWWREPCVE